MFYEKVPPENIALQRYYELMLHEKNYHTWCGHILLPNFIMHYFRMVGDCHVTIYLHEFRLHFHRWIRDRLNYDDDQEFKNDGRFRKYKLIKEAACHEYYHKRVVLEPCVPARSRFLPHGYVSRSGTKLNSMSETRLAV